VLAERVDKLAEAEAADDVPDEWRGLARRSRAGRKMTALDRLREVVNDGKSTPERLRALWALHVTGGIRLEDAGRWAEDSDAWVRSWTVQLYFENSDVLFGHERTAELGQRSVDSLTRLAADASPVVRRFVASALQRVPVEQRWEPLTALLAHAEDAGDHNLPKLYWYAAEGSVVTDRTRALALLKSSRIPQLREFIARRVAQASLSAGP
jgi:HEAT repeat protein